MIQKKIENTVNAVTCSICALHLCKRLPSWWVLREWERDKDYIEFSHMEWTNELNGMNFNKHMRFIQCKPVSCYQGKCILCGSDVCIVYRCFDISIHVILFVYSFLLLCYCIFITLKIQIRRFQCKIYNWFHFVKCFSESIDYQ